MDNLLISIITPTYNSENFIKSTIDSVLNQSYKNWEMLIVDDFSSDRTNDIIKKFVHDDDRFMHIKLKENSGAAVARNIALERARGDYIAFIDSDDLWLPDKLKLQIQFMNMNKCAVCCTSYSLINGKGEDIDKIIEVRNKLNLSSYLKDTRVGFSTVLVDKRIVGDFKMMNIRTRQDAQLLISFLKKGFNIFGISDTLVKYRVHRNSISSNKIKTTLQMWKLYFRIEKFGFFLSIYYMIGYLYNAIKKRI